MILKHKKKFLITTFLLSLLFIQVSFATPEKVLQQYFSAVRSHDIEQILKVFTPDANISTAKKTIHGLKDIRQFYQDGILKCSSFYPEPGVFFIGKNEIAVEITLHCDGMKKKVGDFFTIKNNKITSMRVYWLLPKKGGTLIKNKLP